MFPRINLPFGWKIYNWGTSSLAINEFDSRENWRRQVTAIHLIPTGIIIADWVSKKNLCVRQSIWYRSLVWVSKIACSYVPMCATWYGDKQNFIQTFQFDCSIQRNVIQCWRVIASVKNGKLFSRNRSQRTANPSTFVQIKWNQKLYRLHDTKQLHPMVWTRPRCETYQSVLFEWRFLRWNFCVDCEYSPNIVIIIIMIRGW